MSSKPKQTTSVQNTKTKEQSTSSPWAPAQPYFTDIYSRAAGALDATQNNLYGGEWIAAPTAGQRSSIQQFYDLAPSLSVGAEPLREMAMRIAGGEFLDPNNPILRAGIEGTINPIRTALMNQVMPQITDAAIKGGAYGGTGNVLLQNKALDDYARSSQDISGRMTLDWLNNRFGDIFQTPGMFQSANTLALAPATVTGMAGEQERNLDQLVLDNELAKYRHSLEMPWYGLDQFTNILTAGGFGQKSGTGTTSGTTTTTGPAPDMATQFLQGGLGGLSTLASLGQAFPQTMGALGGGSLFGPMLSILPALSDRRMKDDVTEVGMLHNGLPVYRFRYKGEPGYHIGLMADEVEISKPEAVFEDNDGIKYVDYFLATEN